MKRAIIITGALTVAVGACRGETSTDPPIMIMRNMHQQQRYDSQEEGRFFADKRTMRTPPEGTVPRFPGGQNARWVSFSVGRDEGFDDDRVVYGHEPDSPVYVTTIPDSVPREAGGMQKLVARGQERFNIFCSPCHGRVGDGNGIVYLRSQGGGVPNSYQYPQPTNLNQDRVRHMPDGQLYATISNGVRNMPAYSGQIQVRDRWAIVAYVRALQVSQMNTPGGTP